MAFYRAKDNSIVDEEGRQIAVVLPVACTKKLAREMAAFAAQQANHDVLRKARVESLRKNDQGRTRLSAPLTGA